MPPKRYLPFNSIFNRPPAFYAPFERSLIYEDIHTGWVEYTGDGEFRLRKSPFLNVYSKYTYIFEGDNKPQDGMFISVEGREKKIPVFDRETVGHYRYVFEVQNWEERKFTPAMPEVVAIARCLMPDEIDYDFLEELTVKDFLWKISQGWTNASAEGLDFTMAIQYLSCPPSLYGSGGIGAQVYSLGAGTKAVNYYGTYMTRILPREFLQGHAHYVFIPVRTEENALRVRRYSRRVDEVNYTYLRYLAPEKITRPVNIPLLIESAEPIGGSVEIDPDVVIYQLTALMLSPTIPQGLIRRFEDSIKSVQRMIILNDDLESAIDTSSIPRIAEAMARLYMVERMEEEIFDRAARRFLRYYSEYLDARDVLDRFRKGSVVDRPQTRVSYLRAHLSGLAIKVLVSIVRYREERGVEWVPLKEIQASFSEDIMDAIIALQDYGYIIQKMNYTYVMPVVIDDELSEVEAGQ